MKKHQHIIINLGSEIWKDIPTYEGLYQVSNKGRIKSLGRYILSTNRTTKDTLIQPNRNIWGYSMCNLWRDGERKYVQVHRIVALAFIPNPENKRTVNHKNGNKEDNSVENLEWYTYSEQHKHAFKELGRVNSQQGMLGVSSTNAKLIVQMDMDGNVIDKYYGAKEAQRHTGIHYSSIYQCIKGKYNHAGGFKWKLNDIR